MVRFLQKTTDSINGITASARDILTLALPLILTHFAHVALTTIDIVVLGRLGALEIAAGGLAITLFNQFRTMGTGLVTGLSNLVAGAHTRGDEQRICDLLVAGLFWASVCGITFIGAVLVLEQPLVFLGQNPEVVKRALPFLIIAAPGFLPCLWFQVLRHFTVGLKYPGPLLVITLISTVLSAGLNYILVFGKLGFPALGLEGVALTTAILFLLSFLMFLWVVLKDRRLAPYLLWSKLRWSSAAVKSVWRLGLPIAGAYASEAGFFSVLTLLIGTLGVEALAAQTVLNQIIYIVFMISSGISHAASIHISEAHERADYAAVRQFGGVALGLGFVFMLLVAAPYFIMPNWIVSVFMTSDSQANLSVLELVKMGLIFAVFLQIFDAWQNIGSGIIRGTGDTVGPFKISLFGYWVFGLPLAYLLGISIGFGIYGVWVGQTIGLAVTASLLVLSFYKRARRGTYEALSAKAGG